MTYYTQLLAAGVSPEEAMRSYVANEVMRITNFERYAREQSPPEDYDEQLREGFQQKYGQACVAR